MARRGREAAQKRAREKSRQERQEAKLEKRLSRRTDGGDEPVDEDALMEEFARLSERYETDQISADRYQAERRRIFAELGLEADEGEDG